LGNNWFEWLFARFRQVGRFGSLEIGVFTKNLLMDAERDSVFVQITKRKRSQFWIIPMAAGASRLEHGPLLF